MYIYYYNSSFHHFKDEQLNLNVVSNQQSNYLNGDAYLLNEEEMEFLQKYPKASIQNIFNKAVSNDYTEELRKFSYQKYSDTLFITWQKYLAQGKEEKAEETKQAWLNKVNEIEEKYPYFY